MWGSQCRPDLTVCGSNLTTDCYCESKDQNGDYHIVMTIRAKSIYFGGKLTLQWNDARSPFNDPMLSSQVDYYPGIISDQKNVSIKVGDEIILDANPSIDFLFYYTPDITSATFCVYNLRPNSLIEIVKNDFLRVQSTDSCVTIDITDQDGVLTMGFRESSGCERTGSLKIFLLHRRSQDPLPILKLYKPDPNNVTKTSRCKNGLLNDVDFFTVRGKVNKNGSNSDAYKSANLYLQAEAESSITPRATCVLCQPDLTVCGTNLNTDCYCESKDANGDYHIVMTIMAKSFYSGGKLMLLWNDARGLSHILSNEVDYYPGIIRYTKRVTLKIGSFEKTIDTDPSSDKYKDFRLDYKKDITSATFCVYNLEANSLIEIKENDNTFVHTTSDSCVTLDFTDQSPDGVLTMSFMESGGCERSGSYILRISPDSHRAAWLLFFSLLSFGGFLFCFIDFVLGL